MLRDKRFLLVIATLLVLAAVWDYHYFTRRGHAPARPRAVPAVLHGTPGAAPVQTAVAAVPSGPVAALPPGARNPFLTWDQQYGGKSRGGSTETKGNGGAPAHLQGIAVFDGVRAALIDGEAVREGESVGGIRVVRVENDRVVLARGAERWTERLAPLSGTAPEASR
jgi:hypothetical protein